MCCEYDEGAIVCKRSVDMGESGDVAVVQPTTRFVNDNELWTCWLREPYFCESQSLNLST
jgi:hypothetical protein